MLEDYRVIVRLPFAEDASFVAGAGYGFQRDEATGEIWFWDGQDIWLRPASAEVHACFKGLVRFVPSGEEVVEDAEQPFVAVGDSLVLELWPLDFIKLRTLLPDPSVTPKFLIYQNIDRASAIARAIALIETSSRREDYLRIFRREGEEELPPDEFSRRVRAWVETEWSLGHGIGIFQDPTDGPTVLGEAAAPPSGTFPDHVRADHGVPDGAAGSRRLTLKVVSANGELLHPAYLVYLLHNLEDELLTKSWSGAAPFVATELREVERLPVVQVASDDRVDPDGEPEEDPPPALPSVRLSIRNTRTSFSVRGLFDPYHLPDRGYWRVQSLIPEGEYEDTYEAPPLYAQLNTPRRTTVTDATSVDFRRRIRSPHWFPFYHPDRRQRVARFLLGINMETCRQQHYHDLAPNDLLYEYYRGGAVDHDAGQLELTYVPSASAPSNSRRSFFSISGNPGLVAEDLRVIRDMGANCVRIWVSEYMEGMRFEFTTPSDASTGRGSALMRSREAADAGTDPDLHAFVFPPEMGSSRSEYVTLHACDRFEFASIARRWSASGSHLRVADPSNAAFQELIANAARVQALAGEAGLRVLWTLKTHFGEASPAIQIGKSNIIFYTADRPGVSKPPRLNASGQVPVSEWNVFYNTLPSTTSRDGRLPIEAWIYRWLVSDDSFRDSYLDNFLTPFVDAMERASGQPLGYEVMNEADIVWDRCNARWANEIAGRLSMKDVNPITAPLRLAWLPENQRDTRRFDFPTGWKISGNDLREFIARSADAIRAAIPSGRDRIVISGVLGSENYVERTSEDSLAHELVLMRPRPPYPDPSYAPGPPDLDASPPIALSASAFTKYEWRTGMRGRPEPDWTRLPPLIERVWQAWDGAHGLRSIGELIADQGAIETGRGTFDYFDGLVHNERALLVEAGEDGSAAYDATTQEVTLREILELVVNQGYAGIFVWHYHDPARRSNRTDTNWSLTENPLGTPPPDPSLTFPIGTGVLARLGVRAIQAISRRLGRLLIFPRPRP